MDPKVMEESKERGGVKLISVPSVQEMVKNDSKTIPERYIKEDIDSPLELRHGLSQTSSEIPVIDVSLLMDGVQDEELKLHLACKHWGFFQVINLGITEEVMHKMKGAVAAFFDLPLKEKKKYPISAVDLQVYGQSYVASEDQKLDWGDMMSLMTNPSELRNMHYWPLPLPGFQEAVENYSVELVRPTDEILAKLSILMGMEREALKKAHGEMKHFMRMNYYPTCSRPDLVLGLSPHSDSSSLTFLIQDDEICGLQIKHEKQWVPVKPIPNSLIVNIGDAIEIWSNGLYKSIEHRAVTNASKPRISVATFVVPDFGHEISPLKSTIDVPRMYGSIKYGDYLKYTMERKMDGKSPPRLLC